MSLVDSLLTAMERANGDALVMHVGERPYVIAQSRTIDVSSHALGVGAMSGMLSQLLPAEARSVLDDLGAVEHTLPSRGTNRFTVVAARGGEDIWIEIRRREAPANSVAMDPGEGPDSSIVVDEPPDTFVVVDEPPASMADEPPSSEQTAAAEEDEPLVEVRAEEDAADDVTTSDGEEVPVQTEPALVEEVYVLEASALSEGVASAVPQIGSAGMASVSSVPASPPDETPSPGESSPVEPSAPPFAASPDRHDEPGVVEPMPTPEPTPAVTRTVRIEVPQMMTTTQRLPGVARLLRLAMTAGATELFLTPQARPYLRVDGDIRPIEAEPPLTAGEVETMAAETAPESLLSDIRQGTAIEWLTDVADVGRVRCASFRDHRGLGLLCRIVRSRAVSVEQLDLGPAVTEMATESDGLVMAAGPDGSGKSTILAALVDAINRRRADYIIMLEPEIGLVHENRHALISQREVKGDAAARLTAARAALREEPDVLVVEGVDSADLFELTLDAAGRGVLVLASVPSASSSSAIALLVGLVEGSRRANACRRLADSFRGAVSQLLLRKAGGGRLAAREVVLASGDVSRALADPELAGLPAAIDGGRSFGMTRLNDALVDHVQSGVVDVREAYRKAPDRERLVAALRSAGVDTSLVDRLV